VRWSAVETGLRVAPKERAREPSLRERFISKRESRKLKVGAEI